jgi:hypothetical protein
VTTADLPLTWLDEFEETSRVDFLLAKLMRHEADTDGPCECVSHRILAALDGDRPNVTVRKTVMLQMTRPQRQRVVPRNRQHR